MKTHSGPAPYQKTLAGRVELSGIGVHSGKPVNVTLHPADPNSGVVFSRTDLPGSPDITGHVDAVSATALCTVLGDPSGAHVMTVEHLMAALRAMEVDNVLVEVDSPEMAVMDGSSEVFVDAIEQVGLIQQAARRRFIRVLREVRVEAGSSWGVLRPHEGQRYEVEIDFDNGAIGRQAYEGDLTPAAFRTDLCRARTFGFMKDVETLWAAGFALGSSLENSVVIGDDDAVVNPEGLRYEDEFVRHKTLDAIGDLALAGAPLLGVYRSYRGGHKLNALMLRALLSDSENYEITVGARVEPVASGVGLLAQAGAAYSACKD